MMISAAARQKILVVEDDVELRGMYQLMLRLEGFDVDVAGDGLAALRQLDADPPDAVILDIGLPILDGVRVCEEIAAQAHLRHVPIVVVTASADKLDELDVPCVLRKPIRLDTLVATVRRCLAAAEHRSAAT
jgi:two-component system response regulator MprA